ncbi:MAG: PAC2 family protein [Actinomycetota bacterium]|nr:PAC2 family protein [Actinomycetota bacterium]MDK1291117.1 PAC2 family protein [Actinomycetota bacterium]
MEVIRRHHEPSLRRPFAVIAFGGWNDACDVASTSAEFIIDAHDKPDVFAEIEPDAFYDFQQHRPTITIDDGVASSLRWPSIRFTALHRPNDTRDLVVISGPEPNFHWKTIARSIAELLGEIGVEEVILAGAYVGRVSHKDVVRLSGVGSDAVSVIRSGLDSASYEGPTGMVGVVQGACKESGIRSLSIWAPTPPYLGGNPFPKAVLAIIEKISDITNLHIDTAELITVDADYTRKVDDALEDAGSDMSEFLEELEAYDEPFLGTLLDPRRESDEKPTVGLDPERADALVDEIVKFLEGDS